MCGFDQMNLLRHTDLSYDEVLDVYNTHTHTHRMDPGKIL